MNNQLIVDVANEETRRLKVSLEQLGSSYNVVTDLENLYEGLARFPRFKKLDKGTPEFAAGLNCNLVLFCRKMLSLSILTALRGHLVDAQLQLRKGIEVCAYANKIAKHPHLASIWLDAGNDEDSFELHREKFGKLFPEDVPAFVMLYERYDQCSKMMHASPYGVAHYLATKREGRTEGFFDAESVDITLIHFYAICRTHWVMMRVFERILSPFIRSEYRKSWRKQAELSEERFESIVRASNIPARVVEERKRLDHQAKPHRSTA